MKTVVTFVFVGLLALVASMPTEVSEISTSENDITSTTSPVENVSEIKMSSDLEEAVDHQEKEVVVHQEELDNQEDTTNETTTTETITTESDNEVANDEILKVANDEIPEVANENDNVMELPNHFTQENVLTQWTGK